MKKSRWLLILVSVLFSVSLVIGSPLFAQEGGNAEANKALLLAWFEAESARQYNRVGEFFTEDLIRHSAATSAVMPDVEITSRLAYLEFWRSNVTMFPDYYTTPLMLAADGDYVAFNIMFTGTYAESGSRINVPLIGFARFEDGKIAELWVEWDNLTWNTQMMAPPVETTEAPISSIDDVVGVERIYGDGWAWYQEYTADGWLYAGPRGCAPDHCTERAQFVIEGDQVHFLTSEYNARCADARYEVFVVKHGEVPVGLRHELVGSDCYSERVEAYDAKIQYLVGP